MIDKKLIKNMPKISLTSEFNKALEDKEFKKITSSLKLPKKELIKYTSLFERSASELKNCLKCKGLRDCENEIRGFVYYPTLLMEKVNFSYIACKYQKEYLEKNKYQDNVYLFEMAKELKEARMSEIFVDDKTRIKAIEFITKFIKSYPKNKDQKGLYLHGSFGGGKTYLLAALFNELAKEGIESAIIYFPEFLQDMRASFETNFATKLTHIKKVPLLLIDDIGAENLTGWGRDEILQTILQYRMQEHLPTFFTSNMTIDELETHLTITRGKVDKLKARRIRERIEHLTEDIEMISPNKRK